MRCRMRSTADIVTYESPDRMSVSDESGETALSIYCNTSMSCHLGIK